MEKEFACLMCGSIFLDCVSLTRHIHSKHEQPHQHICQKCGQKFAFASRLNRHIEKVHTNFKRTSKHLATCPLCGFSSKKKELLFHFRMIHKISLESETINFESVHEFDKWKKKLETDTRTSFKKLRGTWRNKGGSSRCTFICHRDGHFQTRGRKIRQVKTIGSNKINGHCPARIDVESSCKGVVVSFISTHVGHSAELVRMPLTKEDKDLLATKIALKIPFDEILQEVRTSSSFIDEKSGRVRLVTRKDLHNIAASYNLGKDLTLLNKNVTFSIDTWVNYMDESSNFIRFFKGQGTVLEEYPELSCEDFFLVLANDAQLDMLKRYGDDLICVDRSYDLPSCDFEVFTISVLDELNQGFPCAFLFSNRADTCLIELFFNRIKYSLGCDLQPTYFFTNTSDMFFEAWKTVMPIQDTTKYFSSWNVDKSWKLNLPLIKCKEKQIYYYNKLKLLLEEENMEKFNYMFSNTLSEMFSDEHMQSFCDYFEKFKVEPSNWALCYRINSGFNLNSQLENVHRTLKHIYNNCLKNKKGRRFVKAIQETMIYIRDKPYFRLILSGVTVFHKVSDIRIKHESSLSLPKESAYELEGIWKVKSARKNEVFTVAKLIDDCGCGLHCTSCSICVHSYHCSCTDAAIDWNMCEHIHLVCQIVKERSDVDIDNPSDTPFEKIEVIEYISNEENLNGETEEILLESVEPTNLDKRKSDLLQYVTKIFDLIENEEQMDTAEKHISLLEEILPPHGEPVEIVLDSTGSELILKIDENTS